MWGGIKDYGYLAVEAFVCISGYLMAYNYKDKLNSMNFITFFKRRYLKIMPLYWITEVCMVGIY